ncbi:MAG: peptidase [Bacteroidetes bacterium]|jgi:rhomboid protease GluP|nr:peptidase [Bacteroidota bacterium]
MTAPGFKMEDKTVFIFNDLSPETYYFLAYESARQLQLHLVKAEKGKSLNYVFDHGLVSEKKLVIVVESDKLIFTVRNVPEPETRVYAEEYADMILSTIERIRKELSIEQIEQSIKKMNDTLFAESNEFMIGGEGEQKWYRRFASGLLPKQGYFVTPILAGINLLVFVLMVLTGVNFFSPGNEALVTWGGNFRPLTLGGEWWRIITSNYLHIGIIHLVFNMYALIYIGGQLEPLVGKLRFFIVYLVTGVCSSLASLWWNDNVISAGASGAIFGTYGFFIALLAGNYMGRDIRKELMTNMLVFVGFNLLIGVQAGFDNAGHVGGVLSGFLLGFVYLPGLRKPAKQKATNLAIVGSLVLMLGATLFVFRITPNDIGMYEKRMEAFSAMEEKALVIFSLPETTPDSTYLRIINQEGMDNWKKCRTLIEEVDKLDLPSSIHERNTRLKDYCDLRLESYGLISLAIKNQSQEYDEEIKSANLRIDAVLKNLNGE